MENQSLRILALIPLFILLTACGGSGSEAGDDEATAPQGNEKEITPAGGNLYIVDEQNNTINVIFPEEALNTPTRVSLSLVADRHDFAIETSHAPAFEIKPHDMQLYRPISVMVNYAQPVPEVDKALIVRENSEHLLVPLADHEYFKNQSDEGVGTRAFTSTAGVFAEGTMSPEQVEFHLNALLDSLGISPAQALHAAKQSQHAAIDDTCYTDINKAIWEAWKEEGHGAEELSRVAELMLLGAIPDDEDIGVAVCEKLLDTIAQMVLNNCIPEDICDHNHQYIVSDSLINVQLCGIYGGEIHDEFYSRWAEVQNTCIKQGMLNFQLSGNLLQEITGAPQTPFKSNIEFTAERIDVPLRISTVNASGFAEIDEDYPMAGGIPLYPLTGGGTIVYYPGTQYEKTCLVSDNGFLRIDIAGTKDSLENHAITIVTHHYHDRTINCPNEEERTYGLGHERSIAFKIDLNPQNGYMGTATAVDAPNWTVNVKLKLP